MQLEYKNILRAFSLFVLLAPSFSFASTDGLEVSGWIPYWHDSAGIVDATSHLDVFDVIHPFVFTVTARGELRDVGGLGDSEWTDLIIEAQKQDIRIIPTIMWNDGASIDTALRSSSLRAKHVSAIVSMVKKGKYDGVDIDYESKQAGTIEYFSRFLKELKAKLGKRLLTCTIEARTPPDSLYKVVPATLTYANDYVAIGSYCDRVEIMAYDQQRVDLKLNSENVGHPYMPVADIAWVRKVTTLALKDIPKEKIVLGIPTYGHHYALTVAPDWFKGYTRIGALNVPDILDIASEYKTKPTRSSSGEMMFTYIPKSSDLKLPSSLKIPRNTPKGEVVAQRALAYANKTGKTVTVNMVVYSDAGAIQQKIDLAKELGLAGVSLFKIDGEEDAEVWNVLK